MKITELKENQVVHCKTHEEAKRVLKLADEVGLKWQDGEEYIKKDNWELYKKDTCYNFYRGEYCSLGHYEMEDHEIISSEKITDMENKTEFFEDKLMEVSDDSTDWKRRVVFGKRNDKYLAWAFVDTVEDAKISANPCTWNYAREIDPFRELKKAWARGEDIQYRYKSDDWIDTPDPAWHPFYEYRIKPKTTYVPFTFEDAELFMNMVVIAKDKSCKVVITFSDDEGVVLLSSETDYKNLFELFTFIDGSPCGKEVEG